MPSPKAFSYTARHSSGEHCVACSLGSGPHMEASQFILFWEIYKFSTVLHGPGAHVIRGSIFVESRLLTR